VSAGSTQAALDTPLRAAVTEPFQESCADLFSAQLFSFLSANFPAQN